MRLRPAACGVGAGEGLSRSLAGSLAPTCGAGEVIRVATGSGTISETAVGSARWSEAWCCEGLQSERGQDELLLLFEQGLKGALGPVLSVEELPVQLGGLLAELLEGDQVVLGRAQGLRQQGRIVRAEGRDRRTERARRPDARARVSPRSVPVRVRGGTVESPLPLAGGIVGLREPTRVLWVSSVRTHPGSISWVSSAWRRSLVVAGGSRGWGSPRRP